MRQLSNVMGVDDAPFARAQRGDVAVVGTVCTRTRLDGVIVGRVRRDGRNATQSLSALLRSSRFREHVQAIVLQGITLAGFNVVDIHGLAEHAGVPVLVVARKLPDLQRIRQALMRRVPGGARKWKLIERAGPMEAVSGVFVQRAGLSVEQARGLITRTSLFGALPEPLRLAHLIAGALATGESRGGA